MKPPTSLPQIAAKHFLTIEQLTVHNAGTQTAQASVPPMPPSFLSNIPPLNPALSSVLLFSLLFSCTIGLQLLKGVRGFKNYALAFIIAIVVSSIPVVLDYVRVGGGQQAKAGPQEVPKQISVDYQDTSSVLILWNTDVESHGGVRYARAPYSEATGKFQIADKGEKTKTHHATLVGLLPGQSYEFEILSGTNWYRQNDAYIHFTFTK